MGVFLQRFGKGHHGAASIGLDIAAESCDFIGFVIGDHSNRAMVNPGGNSLQTRGLGQFHNPFRVSVGGNVDIRDRNSKQRVSDTTANEQRLMARVGQNGTNPLRHRIGQPALGDPRHACILSAKPRRMRAVAPQM